MSFRFVRVAVACVFAAIFAAPERASAVKVDFAADGTCRVGGEAFFPIGIWVYGLDPAVMADLHEHRFNTVVGNGFGPDTLPLIERHGMMCIPMGTDAWVKAAKDSPALLAWYLTDEPEEHGVKPEEVRRMYDELKQKDAEHPIGITHCQLVGPQRYKGSCDFTMTDVYPVTRDRDWPLKAVGEYTAGPRQVHGPGWPNFTFIQTFGGPETDGGQWAQPLPHEVRFMAFNALVHRANGILYFSHWPRAAVTWDSVAKLNRDIERLVPWLIAPGEEKPASAADEAVQIRARKVGDGGWMIIATNTSPKSCRTTLTVEGLGDAALETPFENRRAVVCKAGHWPVRFAAYEEKVYLVGAEPDWPQAAAAAAADRPGEAAGRPDRNAAGR